MQEATQLLCDIKIRDRRPNPEIDRSATTSQAYDPSDDIIALITPCIDESLFDWWSPEMIYGLPTSFLCLLRKVTKCLESNLDVENGQSTDPQMRSDLDDLENEVLEWQVEGAVSWFSIAPVTEGNRLIMEHYTRAFHQALIILFSRKARRVHQRHLQQYVYQVIFHLEEIERVRLNYRIRAGSMLWPAFVAGSYALEHDAQRRISMWLDIIDREGIWSSKLTKDALVDIWSKEKISPGTSSFNAYHIILT